MSQSPSTEELSLEQEWWWRHENNCWKYNRRNHTTTAKTNWANVHPEKGPVRVAPFVEEGEEQFRSLLVTDAWKGPVEWSAHAYEMIRRLNRDRCARNYLDLNFEEQCFLKKHFGDPCRLPIRMKSAGDESNCMGFTDAVRWNLMEHSDRSLISAFKTWLSEQRVEKQMSEPQSGQSRSTVNPSWLWPEMLDLDHHGFRKQATFDADVLQQARTRATRLSTQFWHAVENATQPGLRWQSTRHPEGTLQEV